MLPHLTTRNFTLNIKYKRKLKVCYLFKTLMSRMLCLRTSRCTSLLHAHSHNVFANIVAAASEVCLTILLLLEILVEHLMLKFIMLYRVMISVKCTDLRKFCRRKKADNFWQQQHLARHFPTTLGLALSLYQSEYQYFI